MAVLAGVRQFLSGAPAKAGSKPPMFLKQRSSTFSIVLTVCLAIFTDIFYYGLVVPVIPFSLTVQVGLPEDQVQSWTSILLACYSGALFVCSPLAGLYADHSSSRRWPLLIGLVALTGSTMLLCFGNSIALLVVGRLLQGAAAAIVWSVGCALLVETFDKAAVGVALGYVGTSMSLGFLVAPAVGGAVYNAAGYFAVYYIAFGVVAVDILMRLWMVEKKVARQWAADEGEAPPTPAEGRDVEKQEVVAAGVSVVAPSPPGERDAASPPSLDHGDTATAGISASPQKRSKMRTIWVLLKSPRILAACFGLFAQAGILMGFDAVLALFVQETFGWNSTAAGLMFLAIFLPGFVAPGVGWLADRYGAKWPSFAGYVCSIPLLVCLRFVTDSSIGHKVLLAALLALLGSALVFANTPLMAEITYVIDAKEAETPGIFGEKGAYGVGYGLFTMSFALGGTIGPLWAGYVHDGPGWGTMTWSLALWAASGAVVVFFWLGGKPWLLKKQTEGSSQEPTGIVNAS